VIWGLGPSITFPTATDDQLGSDKWSADADNRWTVPLGGGIGKQFVLGKQPMNAKLQVH